MFCLSFSANLEKVSEWVSREAKQSQQQNTEWLHKIYLVNYEWERTHQDMP